MNEEIAEYEIGKRHLANIMGEDVDSFTQDDIDVCMCFYCIISYIIWEYSNQMNVWMFLLYNIRIYILSYIMGEDVDVDVCMSTIFFPFSFLYTQLQF